jgi:hypothetical protein
MFLIVRFSEVLGGQITTTAATANLENPAARVQESKSVSSLNPLQSVQGICGTQMSALQSLVSPSFGEGLKDHKVGTSGVLVGTAAGVCALVEPCGAVVGGATLIGAGIYAGGAAIYDFVIH